MVLRNGLYLGLEFLHFQVRLSFFDNKLSVENIRTSNKCCNE